MNDTLDSSLQDSPAAYAAYNALTAAGATVWVVGGAVRDTVLGKQPKDIDLMAGGVPEEVIEQALQALPGRVALEGQQFGVYRYRNYQGDEVEVALPRTEESTGPGHTDFTVTADPFTPPEHDLERRDFTANAMAYDPSSGEILDPYGGQADIASKKLSLVNPNALKDDPLRIMRAIVSFAKHDLKPDADLKEAMEEAAPTLRNLPPERIQMELDKLFAAKDPTDALLLAEQTGVLTYVLPELSQTFGFEQNNEHHDLDVGAHSLAVLRAASMLTNDPDVRMAALLHDVGKPDAYWEDEEGHGHFYANPGDPSAEDHETIGANMAAEIMKRLRYPNERIARVTKLIEDHMFPYFDTERGARRFLAKAGDPKTAWDLLTLRQADASGKDGEGTISPSAASDLARSRELLQSVLDKEQVVSKKDLAINGRDLMAMGMQAGPALGRILDTLLDRVIYDPSLNTRDQLLALAQDVWESDAHR